MNDGDSLDQGVIPAVDYAETANMDAWLRHPVLGDPSFDTFEKVGETVHKSEPPYEWAVNGSLFCDPADGAWYYFAGLYGYGYTGIRSDFKIYKSVDKGGSWRDLGKGFPNGFCFDGYAIAADGHPDTVMTYDPETKLYWLAYDWGTNESSWATATHPPEKKYNAGGALAYAENPAGPFTRLPEPIFGNYEISRKIGRFTRAYATTVLKRKTDWIALVLCDSGEYYSWGLVCMTADSPYGKWSEPKVILSVDRPGYYPAPMEYYPCFAVGGRVYAPATSVALNRNYQTMHAAPLEEAHDPAAWVLCGDGNAWHSRPLTDEKYGIWGQTYNGFVDRSDGTFNVMYASRDERGFGTLSVARRLWDVPYSDGFTFSGHAGKSVSLITNAYKQFSLEAEFVLNGTVEVAFDYNGVLGPDAPAADSRPSKETLSNYKALRIAGGSVKFICVDRLGVESVIHEYGYISGAETSDAEDTKNIKLSLDVSDGGVKFNVNGVAGDVSDINVTGGFPALIAHEFSVMSCVKYIIRGESIACPLKYQPYDAVLGAGQRLADWKNCALSGFNCVSDKALAYTAGGCAAIPIYGKWNVTCKKFTIYAPKSPKLGKMMVVVDGKYIAPVDLYSEEEIDSSPVFTYEPGAGRHGIAVYPDNPESGAVVLDILEIYT